MGGFITQLDYVVIPGIALWMLTYVDPNAGLLFGLPLWVGALATVELRRGLPVIEALGGRRLVSHLVPAPLRRKGGHYASRRSR
jgi:hypothetical protein